MLPRARGEWPAGSGPDRVRHAAGLVLLYPKDDTAHVVLTVRSSRVRHAGQVSLPGGVIEPGETPEQAAVREASEEIACAAEAVRVLGRLSPLDIPVSGFRLHPVVGIATERPIFRAADDEVDRIIELPVRTLTSRDAVALHPVIRGDLTLLAPGFAFGGTIIWGATAMVLAELAALLSQRND
ncbi:MAG: CoA pyrophosphatase [Acidobacteria bacterium]|nr:CoA pyrophosphatase [Acidobacteriota bacterium]